MFDAKTNDGYYELGLMTAQLLRDVIISIRTVREGIKPKETKDNAPKAPPVPRKDEVKEISKGELEAVSKEKDTSNKGVASENVSQEVTAVVQATEKSSENDEPIADADVAVKESPTV